MACGGIIKEFSAIVMRLKNLSPTDVMLGVVALWFDLVVLESLVDF